MGKKTNKDRVTTLIGLDRKSDKELEQIFKKEMKKRGKIFSGTVTESKDGGFITTKGFGASRKT
jgi:hypothetical protein